MANKPWPFLKPGDVVDVVAPSSGGLNYSASYYQEARDLLASIGLIARIPSDLVIEGADLFSANNLEYRKNHLIDAFTNDQSKAVLAIRGGYGAAKLIPFLEKITPPVQPKLLLGFSDITALHLFLENTWHWNSMHSTVINQIMVNPQLLHELKPIVFGEKVGVSYKQLVPLNDLAAQPQTIEGSITGGNLSLVQTSLATSWQIQAKDKIIFLEDIGEKGYRIDRMLNHLLQAGIFDSAKAVIFGEITPPILQAGEIDLCTPAIEKFAKQLNIPVLSLPIVGHNMNHNSPLPLGVACSLTLGEEPELNCLTGGYDDKNYDL